MNLTVLLIHFLVGVTAIGYRVACRETLMKPLSQESKPTYKSSLLYGNVESNPQPIESDWRLLKEEDAIRVFVKDNPNGYMSVRMTLNIRGSVASLREQLQNVDGYTDWVYRCASATRLSKPGDSSLVYRVITDVPFPFKDRELIVLSSQGVDAAGAFHSRSSALASAPADDHYATIHHFEASWKATPVTPENLRIEYEVATEPGGEIPAWLYNLAVEQGPLQTMKNLRSQVEEGV